MAPCSRDRWLKTLGLPDKDIITFVSEKYREDFPPGSAYYCGFDEYEVLRDILQVLNADHHLLIKLHPAEKKDKYETIAADTVTVVRETDRDSLLCHSKFIVGMGSMLLLEAALHRPDVLSYRPNDLSGFIGNRLGATYRVLDRQELKEILWGEKEVVNSGFNDKFKGSAQRILQFIEEKLP